MKPLKYISIKEAAFHLNGSSYHCILATICSHQFVRKRFRQGKLVCFSPDSFCSRAGKPCICCNHPQCRSWLRLFLNIEGENYALDLPRNLVPAYISFVEANHINISKQPFQVLASFSLEPQEDVWVFSIHKT